MTEHTKNAQPDLTNLPEPTDLSALTTPPSLLTLREVSVNYRAATDPLQRIGRWAVRSLRGTPASTQSDKVTGDLIHAVDDVDLDLARGEVLGLVGESGSGKSTLARVAAGLRPPSSGRRLWQGQPVPALDKSEQRALRLAVQMIFQDSYASLNPRQQVADIIGEAPLFHQLVGRDALEPYVVDLLQRVGLDASFLRRYPHQLSGGQRSRIGIARALAVRPQVLVCDEALSALDVSIQAQVLNIFMQLQKDLQLTYLFISHDLGVVRHLAQRVAVMYLGRIVEQAATARLYAQPNHPYTRALLDAVPVLEPGKRDYQAPTGEIPSPLAPPSGCHFHPRCPHAVPRCRAERPALVQIAPLHFSACHVFAPAPALPPLLP